MFMQVYQVYKLIYPRNHRAQRVEAISRILMKQQAGGGKFRVSDDALLLTAACVWLLNGLHARPGDGSAERSLMRAVLLTTDADRPDPNTVLFLSRERDGDSESEEDPGLPYNPYGVIFLRSLQLNVEVIPISES